MRVFTDPRCLDHRAPRGFPERPERLSGIVGHLRQRGWDLVDGTSWDGGRDRAPEVVAAVAAVHEERYVERFGRAVAAADHAMSGVGGNRGNRAFAAVRPPGHHAERAVAMGFCFFNNVAVAAEHLRRRHGAERVAIFDWDVHHGNGTQHLFESRADVFYASTHQYPFYPGTGAASETGIGEGEGATLNVPLPAGTDDARYAEAIQGRVIPAIRAYRPDVLLISAGFDAWQHDPLGGMEVSEEGFRSWGAWMRELADEVCGGRLLAVLEGGYDLASLPRLVEASLEGMSGGSPQTD
jgi:acetoin utilization deacetylase AcuC-like enzyme